MKTFNTVIYVLCNFFIFFPGFGKIITSFFFSKIWTHTFTHKKYGYNEITWRCSYRVIFVLICNSVHSVLMFHVTGFIYLLNILEFYNDTHNNCLKIKTMHLYIFSTVKSRDLSTDSERFRHGTFYS